MIRTLTILQPMFLNLAPPPRKRPPFSYQEQAQPTSTNTTTSPSSLLQSLLPSQLRQAAHTAPQDEGPSSETPHQAIWSEGHNEERTLHVYNSARAYYALLNAPAEEVLRCASESPFTYTTGEWLALLQVHVPHRMVTDAHIQQLQRILAVANGMTAGQKVADAMGNVLASIQVGPKGYEMVCDKLVFIRHSGALKAIVSDTDLLHVAHKLL